MPSLAQGMEAGPGPDSLAYWLQPFKKYFERQGQLAHEGLAQADQGAQQMRGGDFGGLAGMFLGPLGYLSSPVTALLPTEQEVYNAPDLPEDAKPLIAGGLGLAAMMLPGNKKGMGRPESLYRAVSEAELENIRKTGQIKSNNTLALPIERHLGLTPFASSRDDALMYAKNNSGGGAKSYILEVQRTPDMRSDYVELPTIFARRNELVAETETLRNTLQNAKAADKPLFEKWIADNSDELAKVSERLQSAGISDEVLASAPKGVRLPYMMTPKPVPASNILNVEEFGQAAPRSRRTTRP